VQCFFDLLFSVYFVAKGYILQQKCLSEGANRKLAARNMLVQLLDLYTDPDSHNAQCYRQMDRQTDGTDRQHDENSRSYSSSMIG